MGKHKKNKDKKTGHNSEANHNTEDTTPVSKVNLEDIATSDDSQNNEQKKKKRLKRQHAESNGLEITEGPHKKSKKKRKDKECLEQEPTLSDSDCISKSRKKKKSKQSSNDADDTNKHDTDIPVNTNFPDDDGPAQCTDQTHSRGEEDTEIGEKDGLTKKQKKKKRKTHTQLQEEYDRYTEEAQVIIKKKKKNKHKSHSEECDEPGESIKNKSKKSKSKTKDVMLKKETKNNEEDRKTTAGQWVTADLGDANRQEKFLRLMGGFKNSTGSTLLGGPEKPFMTKFNSALNKNNEKKLYDKLENQFERARFITLNQRGVGLGFSESGKNSIDTSSRSTKFDN